MQEVFLDIDIILRNVKITCKRSEQVSMQDSFKDI